MLLVLAILSSLLSRGLCVTCPSKQFIERMDNETIHCDIDTGINRCYWYLGSPSKTDPILKLENGIKGGAQLKNEHYDITSNCEMRIIDAQISQEATYTFVAFLSNGSIWRQDISVTITVTPTPLCPRVATCSACEKCTLEFPINTTGKLVCYFNDIRPAASLYWIHSGDVAVTSIVNESLPSNLTNDTWSSTATLEYSLTCGEDEFLYCHIRGRVQNVSTTVQIKSGACGDESMTIDTSPESPNTFYLEKPIIYVMGFLICILISAVLITLYVCRARVFGVLSATFTSDILKKQLKTNYSKNLIPGMEFLSTVCEILVLNDVSKVQHVTTSDEIFKPTFFTENGRVLLKSKPGFGKSFLFQQLLQKWIAGDIFPGVIVIYFQLKFLSGKSSISKQLMTTLYGKCKSIQNLENILKCNECLILLDGLNNLYDVHDSSDEASQSGDTDECSLTVANMLQNDIKSFPKMKVWVTSRQGKTNFSTPFKLVTLTGFTKEHINTFFSGSSRCYGNAEKESYQNKLGDESEIEEKALLLQQKDIKSNIEEAWQNLYGNITEGKTISPIVAHLFAFNYFKSSVTKAQMIPNSNSPNEVSWDMENSMVELSLQIHWYLFACVIESSSQNQWKTSQINTLFREKDVIFEKDKNGYQRDAITTLCMTCRELEVEPNTLTFCEDYPPSLKNCLPKIKKELILNNIKLVKEDFITLIYKSSERTETIRFVNCVLPKKLSKHDLEERTFPTISVVRENGDLVYFFDFKYRMWVNKTSGKSNCKAHEETGV